MLMYASWEVLLTGEKCPTAAAAISGCFIGDLGIFITCCAEEVSTVF